MAPGSTQMIDESISDLLARLSGARADAAWSEFLQRFSPLVMHVVRRYETDHGRVIDCYLHACGALGDDGFHKLRSFRPDGPARFETWLKAVVSNLCVDWRRKQHGRFRPIRAIARLPELDRQVYRCIYVRGMARAECLHTLEVQFPGLTDERLSEINARLFALLTPRHRWQLSTRTAPALALDEGSSNGEAGPALQIEEPGPGPEAIAELDQERLRVNAAMARLPPSQRLLLRLRYEQNLTLDEIARLTRLSDPFRAHRQVQAALAALESLMDSPELVVAAKPGDVSV